MPEFSKRQKRIIDNYYEHLDTIMLAKVQDLVGELYLAESEKKRDQLWGRVRKALVNLKIKPDLIEHIIASRKPELLATHIQDWLKPAR